MTTTEQVIYDFVKAHPLCWTSDVSNETGLTQIELRPMLLKMSKDGHLAYDNSTRIYKWKINNEKTN